MKQYIADGTTTLLAGMWNQKWEYRDTNIQARTSNPKSMSLGLAAEN